MKGFLSFILAMAFAASLLLVFSAYQSISLKNAETETEMLLIELHAAREIELKRTMMNMIAQESRRQAWNEALMTAEEYLLKRNASGNVSGALVDIIKNADDISHEVGMKLKDLEPLQGDYGNDFGLKVDFWCGAMSDEERRSLPGQMLLQSNKTKCDCCWDFDNMTQRLELDKAGNPRLREVTTCTALLDIFVTSDPPSFVTLIRSKPDPRVLEMNKPGCAGDWVFGISVLDERNRIASVAVLPAGSKIRW